MNETLIQKHNKKIKENDKVFILGDFCFANKENTKAIVSKLNGNLTLIMGNHDRARTRKWFLECGFNEVIEYPIILHDFFILSHEPVYLNKVMPYINLHGHLHDVPFINKMVCQKAIKKSLKQKITNNLILNKYVNVCLDSNSFVPFSLDKIIDKFKR
jgi:calcineurin-like phosphoesterase family protein